MPQEVCMFGNTEFGAGHGPWGGGGPWRGGRGGRGGKCGPGGPGGMGALLHGLDLTDEQLLKIAEIKGGTFTKMAHAKIDLMEMKKEIFRELLKPQVDKKKVHAVAQKIKDHKLACMDTMLENMIAFSEILTPEQKKKIQLNKIRSLFGLEEPEEDED
jgi:Spy/CpxP family protein refolding chaperone